LHKLVQPIERLTLQVDLLDLWRKQLKSQHSLNVGCGGMSITVPTTYEMSQRRRWSLTSCPAASYRNSSGALPGMLQTMEEH
jgi:hypothetical protein